MKQDYKSRKECGNLDDVRNCEHSDPSAVGKNVPGERSNDVTVPKPSPVSTLTSIPSAATAASAGAGARSSQIVTLNTSSLFPSEVISHPISHPHPSFHLPSHPISHIPSHSNQHHNDYLHSYSVPLPHSTPFPDLLSPVPFQKYSSPHTFPSPSTARFPPPSYSSSSSSSSSTPFFSPHKHQISDSDSIRDLHGNQNIFCIQNSPEDHNDRLNYTGQFNDTADTGIFEKFVKSKNSVISMRKMKKLSSSSNSDMNVNHIKFNDSYHEAVGSRNNCNKLQLKGNVRADDEYGNRGNDVRDVRTYPGNRTDNYGIDNSPTRITNNRYTENFNGHNNVNENYNVKKYSYDNGHSNKNENGDDNDDRKNYYDSRNDGSSSDINDNVEARDGYCHKYNKNDYLQNGKNNNNNDSNNNDDNNNYNNYNTRNNSNKVHRNHCQSRMDGRNIGDSRNYREDDYNDGNNNHKHKINDSNKHYVGNNSNDGNTLDVNNNYFDNANIEKKISKPRDRKDELNHQNYRKFVNVAVRNVDYSPSRNGTVFSSKSPKWHDNISPIPHSKNENRKLVNTKNKCNDDMNNDDDYEKCKSNRDEDNFKNNYDNNDDDINRRKQISKIDYYVSDNDNEKQFANDNNNNNDDDNSDHDNEHRDIGHKVRNNNASINNNPPLPLPTPNLTPHIYPNSSSHHTSHSSPPSHHPLSSSSSHSSSHPPPPHLIQNPHTIPSILSSSTLYRIVVDSSGISRLTPVTEVPELSKLTISQNVVLNNNTPKEMKILEKNISVSENTQKDSSSQTDSEIYGNSFCQDVIVSDNVKENNDKSDDNLISDVNFEEKIIFPFGEKFRVNNENKEDGALEKSVNKSVEDIKKENEEKSEDLDIIKKDEIVFEHEHFITPPYSPSSLFIVPSYPATNHNSEHQVQQQGQQHTVLLSDIRHLISLSPFISPIAANSRNNNDIDNQYSDNNDNFDNNSNNNINSNDKLSSQNINILNQNPVHEIHYSPTSSSTSTDNFIQKNLHIKREKDLTKSSATYNKNLYGPYSINNLLSNKPVMSMSSSFWKKRLTFMRQGFYHGDSF